MEEWKARWDGRTWSEYLRAGETEEETMAMQQCTHTGRPLGSKEFVRGLEQKTERLLAPRKGGRPAKQRADERQGEFEF